MHIPYSFIFALLICAACGTPEVKIYLGQGIMTGEIGRHSVILQTRLTRADTLIEGDLPGRPGFASFEVSTDSTFSRTTKTAFTPAKPDNDYIVKMVVNNLDAGTRYYYRCRYGLDSMQTVSSATGTFKTLQNENGDDPISISIVTGMNYYHFHFGQYDQTQAYNLPDKPLGYPALDAIRLLEPDYFIGTGDNVYFDHPNERRMKRALDQGKQPHPGGYDGQAAIDEKGIRRKYHEQFVQPRFKALFRRCGTYWEKDDHDYRFNDADPLMELPISHELGVKSFREQLPVVDPNDSLAKTYRTHLMSRDLQIWLLEGRDYRSANTMVDGPEKTLWGKEQLEWLKSSLMASTATFKLIISPTPLVGPDDAYKRDNHTNPTGFRYEGDAFFSWLGENNFLNKNLYLICGDRHWQYHAKHPSGFEEFSTGALVDNNSRAGRLSGDPNSTDPEGQIQQYYIQGSPDQATGGFLNVVVQRDQEGASAHFRFYDEHGSLNYEAVKK